MNLDELINVYKEAFEFDCLKEYIIRRLFNLKNFSKE